MKDLLRLSSAAACLAVVLKVSISLAGTAALHAQEAKPAVPEPQYVNQIQLIGSDGKLADLEKEKALVQTKTRNHFVSVTATSELVVADPASTVRATPGSHFVVRMPAGSENVDPSTVVTLQPFAVEKGKRTILAGTARAGMFQGVKGGQVAETTVPLTFKKYGQSSVEIVPARPLPPGEYTFPVMGIQYCFGVDAK